MAFIGVLGHLANLGQFVEIGQGHAHQREQIRWTRRNYTLDLQALKIDLFGSARDDVRGTYETYMSRLDTMLLLNALLLPFALNTLQFSDEFLLKTEHDCEECVEAQHPWLSVIWVYLIGFSLIMPFWALLMLLRCKIKLDRWLQDTLDELQALRRYIILRPLSTSSSPALVDNKEDIGLDQEGIVAHLSSFIVEYQDFFTQFWTGECEPLLYYATRLLLMSAIVAITLTSFMVWIFLKNRPGRQNSANVHFYVIMIIGLLIPGVLFLYVRYVKRQSITCDRSETVVSSEPSPVEMRECGRVPPRTPHFSRSATVPLCVGQSKQTMNVA